MSYSSSSTFQRSINCCRPIGLEGPQGPTGPRGAVGPVGITGQTGPGGPFGGASFIYQYQPAGAPSLGDTFVQFNQNGFPFDQPTSGSTEMYLGARDASFVSIKGYMEVLQAITGPFKGRVQITSLADTTKYASFYIEDISAVPLAAFPISYTLEITGAYASAANPFFANDYVSVAFVDQGQVGDTGATGPTGYVPDISSNASLGCTTDLSNGLGISTDLSAANPTYPLRSMVDSYNLYSGGDASNAYGWPILPDPIMSVYNTTGVGIGQLLPVSSGGNVMSWSTPMPNSGYIVGATVQSRGAGYASPVVVANYDSAPSGGSGYTSGTNYQPIVSSLPIGPSSTSRWTQDGLLPTWTNHIQFNKGDNIGAHLLTNSDSAGISPPQVFLRVVIYVWLDA